MSFEAFDTKKLDEYAAKAKEAWGNTEAYKEFEEKTKNQTEEQQSAAAKNLMQLFTEFGQMKELDPACEEVQKQVEKLQNYITEHFYTCTNKILAGLGKMYSGGGSITKNIDQTGGSGTATFAAKAIEIFCKM